MLAQFESAHRYGIYDTLKIGLPWLLTSMMVSYKSQPANISGNVDITFLFLNTLVLGPHKFIKGRRR